MQWSLDHRDFRLENVFLALIYCFFKHAVQCFSSTQSWMVLVLLFCSHYKLSIFLGSLKLRVLVKQKCLLTIVSSLSKRLSWYCDLAVPPWLQRESFEPSLEIPASSHLFDLSTMAIVVKLHELIKREREKKKSCHSLEHYCSNVLHPRGKEFD